MSYLKYVNNVLVNSKTCSWLIDTNTYLQRSNFPTAIYLFKQQWKHQNIVWNLFKVNNEDTRTKLMTSFFVFIINFKHIHTLFSVASPDFDKVSMGWEIKRKHVVDLVMFTPTYQETRNIKIST